KPSDSLPMPSPVAAAKEGDNRKSGSKQRATKDSKARALQKERLAVLKEIAEENEKLHQVQRVDEEDLLEAQRQVLQAEFELCESDKERVEILGKLVALAKKREAAMTSRVQIGRAMVTDALKAKANRLEAEIALARAQDQAARPPK